MFSSLMTQNTSWGYTIPVRKAPTSANSNQSCYRRYFSNLTNEGKSTALFRVAIPKTKVGLPLQRSNLLLNGTAERWLCASWLNREIKIPIFLTGLLCHKNVIFYIMRRFILREVYFSWVTAWRIIYFAFRGGFQTVTHKPNLTTVPSEKADFLSNGVECRYLQGYLSKDQTDVWASEH